MGLVTSPRKNSMMQPMAPWPLCRHLRQARAAHGRARLAAGWRPEPAPLDSPPPGGPAYPTRYTDEIRWCTKKTMSAAEERAGPRAGSVDRRRQHAALFALTAGTGCARLQGRGGAPSGVKGSR